jgi:hypothetical protein
MKNSFEEQMALLDDAALVQIVINRNNYEKPAVDAAIKVAISRKLVDENLNPFPQILEEVENEIKEAHKNRNEHILGPIKTIFKIIGVILLFVIWAMFKTIRKEAPTAFWVVSIVIVVIYAILYTIFFKKREDLSTEDDQFLEN